MELNKWYCTSNPTTKVKQLFKINKIEDIICSITYISIENNKLCTWNSCPRHIIEKLVNTSIPINMDETTLELLYGVKNE